MAAATPTADTPWVEHLTGGAATVTAGFFTNPIEVVKIRMQLDGEGVKRGAKPRVYKNFLQAFYQIGRYEGVSGIQGGLVPALGYQLTMNGLRLGTYGPFKAMFHSLDDDWEKREFQYRLLSGALAGVVGAIAGTPFQLIKTQLQAQSRAPGHAVVGDQHGYTTMRAAVAHIMNQEGFGGLFRGVQAAAARVMVGSSIQLTTYESFKEYLTRKQGMQDSFPTHLLVASMSGVCVAVGMNPLDVVSTRLFNQKIEGTKGHIKAARYNGLFDCIQKIFAREGPQGFYKGLFPHFLRIFPHTILTFVIWEQYKQLVQQFTRREE
eukprot:Clim_evm5s32 gene=Clim_evmTU5s32